MSGVSPSGFPLKMAFDNQQEYMVLEWGSFEFSKLWGFRAKTFVADATRTTNHSTFYGVQCVLRQLVIYWS